MLKYVVLIGLLGLHYVVSKYTSDVGRDELDSTSVKESYSNLRKNKERLVYHFLVKRDLSTPPEEVKLLEDHLDESITAIKPNSTGTNSTGTTNSISIDETKSQNNDSATTVSPVVTESYNTTTTKHSTNNTTSTSTTESDQVVFETSTNSPVIESFEENLLDDIDLNMGDEWSTLSKVDHHRYYNSYFADDINEAIGYWVDLDKIQSEKVISHAMLSHAHRRALTVSLSFKFPFYGHVINNITIATGGFLFTGAFLHKWLAATQYIAPLMANFDTSLSKDAIVKYSDNGTSLTVQWEKVVLQDSPDVGPFTFQVTIHNSGSIIFVYKDVPVTINLIEDSQHPVKIGLSDAYIVEKTIFYVRKKTIYEYHKIDLMEKEGHQISNYSAIVFKPLPNCVAFDTCDACLNAITHFKCQWCNNIGHCSDGVDRQRQDWLEGNCRITSTVNSSYCAGLPPPPTTKRPSIIQPFWSDGTGSVFGDPNGGNTLSWKDGKLVNSSESEGGSGVAVTLIIIFVTLLTLGGWVTYAYFQPHSPSGQFLIRYRPSTWSWWRGHARYTAATMHSIHM